MTEITISFYDICVDIIIPVLSAAIGGLLTMWGVLHTIKQERKNATEQTKLAAKPWIFSMDDFENFDCREANDIILSSEEIKEKREGLTILIRNTDNGVGIIEKVQTKSNTYFPEVGRVLDKSTVSYVHIFLAPNESLEDMYLHISDVYGNKYFYKIIRNEGKASCTIVEIKKDEN